MPPGIAGKEIEVWQIQLIDQMSHAARMFVPSMEHQHAAAARISARPVTIEETSTIMGLEAMFLYGARRGQCCRRVRQGLHRRNAAEDAVNDIDGNGDCNEGHNPGCPAG